MNENLNLAEILEKCPKGTELYSTICGKCFLSKIYPHLGIDVISEDNISYNFLYDGRFTIMGECTLFPSKDQRDWSKWQRPFVKGDVLVSKAGNIVLYSHIDEKQLVHYHCILNFLGTLKIRNDIGVGYSYNCNLANDFQKQKLFDALKKEGYEWDAEKKELKPLQEFKDGDIIYNRIQKRICICHYRKDEKLCVSHCRYNVYHKTFEVLDNDICITKQDYRLATEEEKQKLFQAIKDNGYKWNTETKTLEKVKKEKFDLKILKPFDKVLVRDIGCETCWHIQFFEQ